MLCFEVSRNGNKLALCGLRESGVLSFILSWVGRGEGASARAAATDGPIPELNLHVGGLDTSNPAGDAQVHWVEDDDLLKLGDDITIRLVAAEVADPPTRTEPSKPASRTEDGTPVIECSFCEKVRIIEPPGLLKGGVAGADAFICARCLAFAERLIDERLPQLAHMSRATDQTCSFCKTERAPDAAAARGACICRACVDLVAKGD
jgi:hypothetical protein